MTREDVVRWSGCTPMVAGGGDGQQATVHDQRNKFRETKADLIDWNRQTGQIYAPKASVIGR